MSLGKSTHAASKVKSPWWSPMTGRLSVIAQFSAAAILLISAGVAERRWNTDATLKYLDKLTDREYVDYLWDLEGFTLCFEAQKKQHLSYREYASIKRDQASADLARQWWNLVENEREPLDGCGKPTDIERKLMVVYSRLEGLASCADQKLCTFTKINQMREAFDYHTLLSISNYLLLTEIPGVSREWRATGSLKILVGYTEEWVFHGKNTPKDFWDSVFEYLPYSYSDNPIISPLTPAAIEQIWSKTTRCSPPKDKSDNSTKWRQCQL